MSPLGIHRTQGSDRTVLRLVGELDLSAATEFEEALAAVEPEANGTIVLDLSELAFMDSTGLRLILTCDERVRELGRRLVVVRGPEAVDRVFRITALDRRLEIVDEVPT